VRPGSEGEAQCTDRDENRNVGLYRGSVGDGWGMVAVLVIMVMRGGLREGRRSPSVFFGV
jgi:hypothetical protein